MKILKNDNSGFYNIKPYTGTEDYIISRFNEITISISGSSFVYTGSTVNFSSSVIYNEDITNYQWKSNGINVGTNSSTYSITGATFGTYNITCTITSQNRNYDSNTILLTVLEGVYLSSSPVSINTSGVYSVPTGKTSMTIHAWGGGGGSGGASYSSGYATTGGGGGGAYAKSTISVTGNTTIYITIGAGGASGSSIGGNGGNGSDTIFRYNNLNLVVASGGGGSVGKTTSGNGAGGAGGSSTNCTGDTSQSGGNGSAGGFVTVIGNDTCSDWSGLTFGGAGGSRANTGSTGMNGMSISTFTNTNNWPADGITHYLFAPLEGGLPNDSYVYTDGSEIVLSDKVTSGEYTVVKTDSDSRYNNISIIESRLNFNWGKKI